MDFEEIAKQELEEVKVDRRPEHVEFLPQQMNDLDIEVARQDLSKYKDAVDAMLEHAKAHETKDEISLNRAVASASNVKKLDKEVEKVYQRYAKPANDYLKKLRNTAKPFRETLKNAEAVYKRGIAQYQSRKELERRKQEEAIRKANEELQKKLNKEAKKSGVEAPTVTPAPLPKQESITRVDDGSSAHIRKQWKAEIVDASEVPRNYCSPDLKIINDAVKMGVREIPGVRIFEDIQTVIKT